MQVKKISVFMHFLSFLLIVILPHLTISNIFLEKLYPEGHFHYSNSLTRIHGQFINLRSDPSFKFILLGIAPIDRKRHTNYMKQTKLVFLAVDDWSPSDKKNLLVALRKCGTSNMSEVQKYLPRKTITEIRTAFETYSRLASKKMDREEKLREEDSAINQWIEVVKKRQGKSSGVTDIIPRVLKYIALFEKRPNDSNVNLRDCYMALSEMTSGMVSKNLDAGTNHFFFENLSKLALKIKKNNNERKLKFVKEIKILEDANKVTVKTYKRKKKKSSIALNPLNIPHELLKIEEDNSTAANKVS